MGARGPSKYGFICFQILHQLVTIGTYEKPSTITQMLHGAGIFTNICPKDHPNVGKYTIHGAYGI